MTNAHAGTAYHSCHVRHCGHPILGELHLATGASEHAPQLSRTDGGYLGQGGHIACSAAPSLAHMLPRFKARWWDSLPTCRGSQCTRRENGEGLAAGRGKVSTPGKCVYTFFCDRFCDRRCIKVDFTLARLACTLPGSLSIVHIVIVAQLFPFKGVVESSCDRGRRERGDAALGTRHSARSHCC